MPSVIYQSQLFISKHMHYSYINITKSSEALPDLKISEVKHFYQNPNV